MEAVATENQTMIAQMVRDFGAQHIKPNMMKWDESQEFPIEVFRKLGELGLMGVLVPQQYGGAGFGYMEYVTAIAELSKIDGSIGLSMAAHNSLCTGHILQHASEEQKQKYLPKLASGRVDWGLGPHRAQHRLRRRQHAHHGRARRERRRTTSSTAPKTSSPTANPATWPW